MAKSIKVHPKKRRGRPATGKDPLVSARLPQTLIDQVEHWAASSEASRSEAIRRLVELGLETRAPAKPAIKASNKTRAVELAAKAVDKMIDPTAPADERVRRRRRLTKGPQEFREDRVDLPKPKGK
jgi:Arc/MetJ-type ribon-helix-helix transcriptional regulator